MTNRQPVAYLRKSRQLDRAGVSYEMQEAKVRELAATYGDKGGKLLILSDWNVSGRKGAAARPDYARLLAMLVADQVSAIYGYNLARLSRSVQDLRALFDLADKHGTPVRLVADHVDTSTATGRMLFTILSAVDEMTSDLASEHARDAVAARRARGDHIGSEPYGAKAGEDPRAVVAAFLEAGSIRRAALLLNERGIPTRQGKPWGTTSVHDVLLREGALPFRTRRGAKASAPYVLYGLLRCHCGRIMTGDRSRHGYAAPTGAIRYRCHRGRTVPGHGLYAVPELRILPWIKAEAARLRVPETVEIEKEHQAERDKIETRKLVIADMYETNGPKWRDDYQRRMAAVKAAEKALDAQEAATAVLAVPDRIEWETWAPEAINAVLTAMWQYVELDDQLRPVRAEWSYPAWRE
jgi:DNA invertase Pin-like site-specific DNA recombinase